jgi:predicted nucleic acid-binding protein
LNKNGYLLDTDVLIAFLRGKNSELKDKVDALLQHHDIPLFISVISLGELGSGFLLTLIIYLI